MRKQKTTQSKQQRHLVRLLQGQLGWHSEREGGQDLREAAHRGSSGWMATAVSPSIVSGRVVATTISPSPPSSRYLRA